MTRKLLSRHYVRNALFIVPPISLLVNLLFFGREHFWIKCLYSLIVSEVCYIGCNIGETLVGRLEEAFFRARGRIGPVRNDAYRTLRGIIWVFPCMSVAFVFAGLATRPLGLDVPLFPDWYSYSIGLVISAMVIGFFLYWGLRGEYKKSTAEASERIRDLENSTMRAQLSALRAQMNPHFLFNSLNTIAAAIEGDPKLAEAMTVNLASLYRKVLEASRRETHTLGDELQICRAYLELEQARFSDRLQYSIDDIDVAALNVMVPSLLLQPIVENAVKHGVLQSMAGGEVHVSAAISDGHLHIDVADTGIGLVAAAKNKSKGTGVGLSNCRERLSMMFGSKASFDLISVSPKGTKASLRLPVRVGA